jgi:hypothetical protein
MNTSDQDDGWPIAQPDAVGMSADVLSGLAPQFESWRRQIFTPLSWCGRGVSSMSATSPERM